MNAPTFRGLVVCTLAILLSECSGNHAAILPAQAPRPASESLQRAAMHSVTFQSIGPHNLWGGPASGKINVFAPGSADGKVLYVAGGYGQGNQPGTATGMYRSNDGGATWARANNGLTDSLINDLWVSPNVPGTLVASTHLGGLFRSVNYGDSWVNVSTVNEAMGVVRLGTALYAANRLGVLVSRNDGAQWSPALNTSSGVNAIGASNVVAFAGLDDGTVYRSTDGSWHVVGKLPGPVHAFAIDPASSASVFATINGLNDQGFITQLLYHSANRGATWSALTALPSDMRGAQILAFSTIKKHALYVGGGSTVYLTTNGGASFIDSVAPGDARSLRIIKKANGTESCYIGGDQGAFLFDRCGDASTVSNPAKNLSTNIATGVAAGSSIILAMLQDYSAYVTFDKGTHWSDTDSSGAGFFEDGRAAINPLAPKYCYGYDGLGFEMSSDGCHTFRVTGPFSTESAATSTITFDPKDPSIVYAASKSGLMKSINDGRTFAAVGGLPGSDIAGVTVDPTNGKRILAGVYSSSGPFYGATLYATNNGGRNWTSTGLNTTYMGPAVAIDPRAPKIVVAAYTDYSGVEVSRSTDGGITWGSPSLIVHSTIVFPRDPFHGRFDPSPVRPLPPTLDAVVRRSPETPRSTDCTMYGGCIFFPFVGDLQFNPASAAPALVMATGDGVYASPDAGATWRQIDRSATSHIANQVVWVKGYLYVATAGQGILKSTRPLQ